MAVLAWIRQLFSPAPPFPSAEEIHRRARDATEEVVASVREGRMAHACRCYRRATGVRHPVARAVVRELAAAVARQGRPTWSAPPTGLETDRLVEHDAETERLIEEAPADVVTRARAGDLVTAIQLYRRATGASLDQARIVVQTLRARAMGGGG